MQRNANEIEKRGSDRSISYFCSFIFLKKKFTTLIKKAIYLLLPLFLIAGTGVAQNESSFIPTEKALLWKITGSGMSKPSYLYGTIHIISKKDFSVSPELEKALKKSKKIAFEIDMKEMTSLSTQFSLITKAFMKNGTNLKDLLEPEDYSFVAKKMQERGLPVTMFGRLKPMFLSMMLSNEEEGVNLMDPEMTSVEMELYDIAKKNKTPSAGLETVAYQMSIFDAIPYEVQAEMLVEGLRNVEAGGNELEVMMQMYRDKDINGMQSIISEEGGGMAEYEDKLLNDRNENWIPEMMKMMKKDPVFFAVGAGHLGGAKGVIALLRKEGLKVEPVVEQ